MPFCAQSYAFLFLQVDALSASFLLFPADDFFSVLRVSLLSSSIRKMLLMFLDLLFFSKGHHDLQFFFS